MDNNKNDDNNQIDGGGGERWSWNDAVKDDHGTWRRREQKPHLGLSAALLREQLGEKEASFRFRVHHAFSLDRFAPG